MKWSYLTFIDESNIYFRVGSMRGKARSTVRDGQVSRYLPTFLDRSDHINPKGLSADLSPITIT